MDHLVVVMTAQSNCLDVEVKRRPLAEMMRERGLWALRLSYTHTAADNECLPWWPWRRMLWVDFSISVLVNTWCFLGTALIVRQLFWLGHRCVVCAMVVMLLKGGVVHWRSCTTITQESMANTVESFIMSRIQNKCGKPVAQQLSAEHCAEHFQPGPWVQTLW